MNELVLVLDFGGQYKELIARTVRGLSVYSEIRPGNTVVDEIKNLKPIGIIMTGGPNSVYLPNSFKCDPGIFKLGIPILGICYGMQLMCQIFGGDVRPCKKGEFGRVKASLKTDSVLFAGIHEKNTVLMSHTDFVSKLPDGFVSIAATADCPHAACESSSQKFYGVQFHPEVEHTDGGRKMIEHFLYDVCGAKGDYRLDDYIDTQVRQIRQKVGYQKVLLALSGGVDSSVCAGLLTKAIPGQVTCIFVDHGFMRKNEGDEIERVFSSRKLNFIRVNAQRRFLSKIKGVTDPERKRKIIGDEFARVFEEEAGKLGSIPFMVQGTIYPDVIESGGKLGSTIKSHHNVGGLPENLAFAEVIEPLSGLFKDEVRILGKKLGLPASLTERQPFPGPGLAIRIMGEVTQEKLEVVRMADFIMCEEMGKLKRKPQQYFAVYTGTCSVGVKGDDRTYDAVIALRAVTTSDFMTGEYTPLSHKVLSRIASRITSEISSVSRVVYDITSKPPATVEWE
ncbi:MAG: glutamine-hydrolyzing GMP synthase [Eubacteriales bacterium]|nr:glutamine-hydrolyzing GMP synthase [Eubacteriales bacterium]